MEQHGCMKFCFKVGKSAAELHKMLVKTLSVRHKPMTGWNGLKMAKHQLMMNVLGDLQSEQ